MARRRGWVALALASLMLLASAGVALASTIIVNTTSDPSGTNGCLTDGTCSLRDAVAAASSDDTIELGGTSASPEVYSLTQGSDIDITTSLTLAGGGVLATSIDGSQNNGGQVGGGDRPDPQDRQRGHGHDPGAQPDRRV